jgi:hypothetical protein
VKWKAYCTLFLPERDDEVVLKLMTERLSKKICKQRTRSKHIYNGIVRIKTQRSCYLGGCETDLDLSRSSIATLVRSAKEDQTFANLKLVQGPTREKDISAYTEATMFL